MAYLKIKISEYDTAYTPSKGVPRLLRYDLPDNDIGLLSEWDPETNLLRINRKNFDTLNEMEKMIVGKTMELKLYMTDVRNL